MCQLVDAIVHWWMLAFRISPEALPSNITEKKSNLSSVQLKKVYDDL